jgi:hypothetical protein
MTKGKSEVIKLTMPVSESKDHIQGSADAPVTLVDTETMNALILHRPFRSLEIRARLCDTICFVFRNFPLNEIHPRAEHGA